MSAILAPSQALDVGRDLAVAISIANDITVAARAAVEELALPVSAILAFKPSTGIGIDSIPSAAHLRAFIDSLRNQLSVEIGARKATRVHFFYSGPLAGAAFLGHALGAAVPEAQIYEFQRPGYAPSFLLRG